MYEVKYKVRTTKIHSDHSSFIKEWDKDLPNFADLITQESVRNSNLYQINRKDASFNDVENCAEVVVLFNTKQGALDYTRWAYNNLYDLQMDKMSYNDTQFEQYILNTDVTILDGKYTASVESIKEIN